MNQLFLLVLLVLSSCATKPKSPDEGQLYYKLNQKNFPKHQACMEQRENVLEDAVTEFEEVESDEDPWIFIADEKSALGYIQSLDINKFALKENREEHEAVVKSCLKGPQPQHQTCETTFSAYKFYAALIHGMHTNKWSKSTVELGKAKTIAYLNYLYETKYSILDVILGNELVHRMARHKLIPKQALKDSKAFRIKAEKEFAELREKVKTFNPEKLSCEEALKFYAYEDEKVLKLWVEFGMMLKKNKL